MILGGHDNIFETGDIHANLAGIAAAFVMGVDAAMFTKEVTRDFLVPLIA